jgi:hypothetical protein
MESLSLGILLFSEDKREEKIARGVSDERGENRDRGLESRD